MILTTVVKIGKLLTHLDDNAYSLAKESQAEEPENLERQVI
jgi:hypothetical protein